MISKITAMQKAIADQQEYLAAMRQLMATQGAGYAFTGGNSLSGGGDLGALFPSELQKHGIKVPTLAVTEYEHATGLKWHDGDPAPDLITLEDGTRRYVQYGNVYCPTFPPVAAI